MRLPDYRLLRIVAGAAVVLTAWPSSAGAIEGGSIVGWGTQVVGADLSTGLVAVTAGLEHSLGLKADGSIVAWGGNRYGQCNVPAPNTGFVAVEGGNLHSLGLRTDGSIVAWGYNGDGQCNVPALNIGFVAIAAGDGHSMGLKADGSIVAWGRNTSGECNVAAPNSGFVTVAAGWHHSLGLKTDGSIVAWGYNGYGQCNVPSPNMNFVAIAGGGGHSLGLKADGSIVAWGWNRDGQCNVPSPNMNFISIAGGGGHSLGLKANGSIVAWGWNYYGECNVPVPNTGFVAVAGSHHGLGLKADGAVVAWGRNWEGQCNILAPNMAFMAVAGGGYHSLGLKADSSVVAWGYNYYGECNVPAPNTGFSAVAGGWYHSLGLQGGGAIAAWGYNSSGQCNVPAPNTGFVGIAGGGHHSMGLKTDGSIVAWGYNGYGQCNVPSPNMNFVAIAGGESHSLGLKADGSIVAWGRNYYGQCNVPDLNTGFVAIAGGESHSLGLKADGSIVAWGYNGHGQCNVPAPNAAFIAVAAGYYHSLGLKVDGSIVAWGRNTSGECNVAAPNSGFVAVAAGLYHSLGIKIQQQNPVPVIWGASASQLLASRTVAITYSLSSPNASACQVDLAISSNGGLNYTVIPASVSPVNGSSIAPGANRLFTWDAGTDWPNQQSSQMRVRIAATHPSGTASVGYSPLFALDTRDIFTGSVSGRVVDTAGIPIHGAAVKVEPGLYAASSGTDGAFLLPDVPVGYGYSLDAVGAGYESAPPAGSGMQARSVGLSSITVVPGDNPQGDIVLSSFTGPVVLAPLPHDVNTPTSEVEEDGVAYRYYVIRKAADLTPAGGVAVTVRAADGGDEVPQDEASKPGWAGTTTGVSDFGTGIVRLRIPASAGSSFEVVAREVPFAPVLTFQVNATPRSYEHTWSQDSNNNLSLKFRVFESSFGGGAASTAASSAELVRSFENGSATKETIRVQRMRGSKTSWSWEPSWGLFEPTAETGQYSRTLTGYGYSFNPLAEDEITSSIRLGAVLYYSPERIKQESLFPFYSRLVELSAAQINQALAYVEGGGEVGTESTLEGMLSGPLGQALHVGVAGEQSSEAGDFCLARSYLAKGTQSAWTEREAGFVAEERTSTSLAMGIGPVSATLGLGYKPGLHDKRIALVPDESDTRATKIKLTTTVGGELSSLPREIQELVDPGRETGERYVLVTQIYSQALSVQEWQGLVASYRQLLTLFQYGGSGELVTVGPSFYERVLRMLQKTQCQADAEFSIEVEVVDRQHQSGTSRLVWLGASTSRDTSKGRRFTARKGIIRGGRLYPQEDNAGLAGISPNSTTFKEVQEDWDAWAKPITQGIFSSESRFLTPGEVFDFIKAHLRFPAGSGSLGYQIRADQLLTPPVHQLSRRLASVSYPQLDYGVGGIYRFTSEAELSSAVEITLDYDEGALNGIDENLLQIYRLNEDQTRWVLVGGQVDSVANAVTASVTVLGAFALAPPFPAGQLSFTLDSAIAPADGVTIVTARAGNLTMNDDTSVPDGWGYTVTGEGLEVISADEDSSTDGIQVASSAGTVAVALRAPTFGGVGQFTVRSVHGDASGQGMIAFMDNTPPPDVTEVAVVPRQSKLLVAWTVNGMPPDVADYRVYFSENHPGPPFDGTAAVDGQPSPVSVTINSAVLRGLNLGATYYVAVSAVDASGNEGPLSTITTTTTLESAPSAPSDIRFAVDGPERYVISWNLSEDDGFNDRDVDHYEMYRSIGSTGQFQKVGDVSAGISVYTDADPSIAGAADVSYAVVAVDTAGLKSSVVGFVIPADFTGDGYVDGADLSIFVACATGAQVPYDPNALPSGCTLTPDENGFIAADFNGDGAVDMNDFGIFQRCYSGAGNPANANCAN